MGKVCGTTSPFPSHHGSRLGHKPSFRTNPALFLKVRYRVTGAFLLHPPARPTLSAYARNLPLPYSAQAKLNRLWRYLRHPALQNPWILTRALLPLLSPRAAKGKLLPLLVDWTPLEDGKHQALVAALPLRGRVLVVAFEVCPSSPWPSASRVEARFLYRLTAWVKELGFVPLFLADRGFDATALLKRLKDWGAAFLIRLKGTVSVVSEEGERFVLKARYPRVPAPFSFRAKLKGEVPVHLFLSQEGEEPWYLALSLPEGSFFEPQGYAWRMWIEEGFRDLKGAGLGLDRHLLRTRASLVGWLSLLFLAQVMLVLLGAGLEGRPWLHRLVAHPERQSLFTLGRLALAQPPPGLKGHILRLFHRVLAELAGGRKGGRK